MKLWYARDKRTDRIGNYIFCMNVLYDSIPRHINETDWRDKDHNYIVVCKEAAELLLDKQDHLEPGEGPKEIEILFGDQVRIAKATSVNKGASEERYRLIAEDTNRKFVPAPSKKQQIPHLCPKCDGKKFVVSMTSSSLMTCMVCEGEGVLWK